MVNYSVEVLFICVHLKPTLKIVNSYRLKVEALWKLLIQTMLKKMKVLSSDENAIYIDGCNFLTNQKSKEADYFVAGESRRSLNIVNCSFKGKLAKSVNFIDGKFTKNQESDFIIVNSNQKLLTIMLSFLLLLAVSMVIT